MGQGQGNYGNNARGFGSPQRGLNSQFGGPPGGGTFPGGGMGLPDWMNNNGNPQMGLATPTDSGGYSAGAANSDNGYGINQNAGRLDFGYNPGEEMWRGGPNPMDRGVYPDVGGNVPPGTGGGDPNPANDRPIFGGGTGGPQGPYQLPVQTGGLEPRDIPLDYNGRGRFGGLLGQGGGISQQGYQSPYADMRSPQMGLRRF